MTHYSNTNDIYQHVINLPSKVQRNDIQVSTFYLSSANRDIIKYPNKYNCSIEFNTCFTDIYIIELTKIYLNLKDRSDYNKNNIENNLIFSPEFEINNQVVNFSMNLLYQKNNNLSNQEVINLYNNYSNRNIDKQWIEIG